jgi:hypothetical protein
MTTPTPGPAPAHEGPIKHVEEWIAEHVRPELADARIKAEQAIAFVRSHAQQADALGGILVRLVKTLDPAEGSEAAVILADAEQWAAEAARIAESVLGTAL